MNHLPLNILILEISELLAPADWVMRWVRALGERGVLGAVDGVMVARPPVSSPGNVPPAGERARLREAQRDAVSAEIARYNPTERPRPLPPAMPDVAARGFRVFGLAVALAKVL